MTASLTHIKGQFTETDGKLTKSAYDFLAEIERLVQQALFQSGEFTKETVSPAEAIALAGDIIPTGTMIPYAGTSTPAGYAFCNGGELGRNNYARLFAVIGTTFGPGDGFTTFNVPNMQDKYPIGKSGTVAVGDQVGDNEDDISHTHGAGSYQITTSGQEVQSGTGVTVAANNTYGVTGTSASGGDTTHDNRPASIGLNWIIKY